jgi:hypothetical protein
MTKNYFTDEQVKEIVDMLRIKYGADIGMGVGAIHFYKSLMNLAVESAIGEKLAFRVEHFDGEYELNFNETWQKVKEQFPLYSVKELEN